MTGNNPLHDNMKYKYQCWYDPDTQHFTLYDLSKLNYASGEAAGPGGLHVRNKVTLNDENFACKIIHIWINSVWCRFSHICIMNISIQIV